MSMTEELVKAGPVVPVADAAVSGGPDDRERWPWEPPLPPQRRGRERRARIITAASALIDAHGPSSDRVTLRAIADAAATSIASIYHYFPDVESVVAAVATAYMDGLLAATGAVRPVDYAGYEEFQLALVGVFRTYFAARPGLRRLWFQRGGSDTVARIHDHYRGVVSTQLQAAAGQYVDDPGDLLNYVMVIDMSRALWDLAFSLDPDGHPEVVREIHDNASAFLRRRVLQR
jgi:AcrR family transcriptional regulator